jgi:hypothetical protein
MSISKNEYEAFADGYKTEEQEIVVLFRDNSGGAGKAGGEVLWTASASFLAYVDETTGEVKKGDGRVEWLITDDDRNAHGSAYPYHFKDAGIYRLLVRDLKDRTVPEGRMPSFYNRFLVVRVLEENARNDALTGILEDYRTPVVLKDDLLGEFVLNKNLSLFDGRAEWCGKDVSVSLEVDGDDEAIWASALGHIRALFEQQTVRDGEFRGFAVEKLTELANDWREDESVAEITAEVFADRIGLAELSVDMDGNYCAYYDDDDMFYGHIITVYGNVKSGMKDANIEG